MYSMLPPITLSMVVSRLYLMQVIYTKTITAQLPEVAFLHELVPPIQDHLVQQQPVVSTSFLALLNAVHQYMVILLHNVSI